MLCLVWFFLKTYKMHHQISSMKEACQNSHEELLYNWKHLYLPSLLRIIYFPFMFLSFFSSQTCNSVWKWSGSLTGGGSTHSCCSVICGRGAVPAALVVQQPAQNSLGPREVWQPELAAQHHSHTHMTCLEEDTQHSKWAMVFQCPAVIPRNSSSQSFLLKGAHFTMFQTWGERENS